MCGAGIPFGCLTARHRPPLSVALSTGERAFYREYGATPTGRLHAMFLRDSAGRCMTDINGKIILVRPGSQVKQEGVKQEGVKQEGVKQEGERAGSEPPKKRQRGKAAG
eukprot:448795-Pyramimonas_sp.AAC.1